RGNPEIGFNKLVYQLLVKFGRLYGDHYRLYMYLDERTTSSSLIEFRSILNAGLRKHWDVRGWPLRRLHFRNSKASDLFQINDLLIGAIAHRKNGHHLQANASPSKREFVQHIRDAAGNIPRRARVLTVWNFRYGRR